MALWYVQRTALNHKQLNISHSTPLMFASKSSFAHIVNSLTAKSISKQSIQCNCITLAAWLNILLVGVHSIRCEWRRQRRRYLTCTTIYSSTCTKNNPVGMQYECATEFGVSPVSNIITFIVIHEKWEQKSEELAHYTTYNNTKLN